jgi:hypothetical protein
MLLFIGSLTIRGANHADAQTSAPSRQYLFCRSVILCANDNAQLPRLDSGAPSRTGDAAETENRDGARRTP